MGLGYPQSAPLVDTVDAKIVFKPTTGIVILVNNDQPTQTQGRHNSRLERN